MWPLQAGTYTHKLYREIVRSVMCLLSMGPTSVSSSHVKSQVVMVIQHGMAETKPAQPRLMAACLKNQQKATEQKQNQSCPESDPEESELEPGTMAAEVAGANEMDLALSQAWQCIPLTPALKRQANLNGQNYTKKPPQKNRIFAVMKDGIPNHFNKAYAHACLASTEWAP